MIKVTTHLKEKPDKGLHHQSFIKDVYHRIANGDQEAEKFLWLWGVYLREVDDIIDEKKWDAESILGALVTASAFYSCPFYQRHNKLLQMPIIMATNFWADSIKWEGAREDWKKQWADVLRHAGNEVILAVAMITDGWEAVREQSAGLMAMCYVYHADKHGVPGDPDRQLTTEKGVWTGIDLGAGESKKVS